jgi:hypothetical protein
LWLYLVPVVLLGAAGVWAVTSGEDSYQSVGTMKVEPGALVAELTGSQQDPGFGWETPAGATAASLNALLRTQTFVDQVAVNAGLEETLDSGLMSAGEVPRSIAVYPDGARLVKVVGTNRNPDLAHRLADATIESYVDTVMANELSDSVVAMEFLEQKLPDYEASVTEAEAALEDWLAENPDPPDGESRPEDEQVEFARLQQAVSLRDQRLTEIQGSIEQAELSVEQKEAEVRQRLEVIDPPQQPTAPQPKLKKAVMTVAMALVLGCLVALAAIVIGTILDRTIRFPGDVRERLGTRVLAVVPRARLTAGTRKRLETAGVDTPAVVRARAQEDRADLVPSSPTGAHAIGPILDDDHSSMTQLADGTQGPRLEPNGARASIPLKRVP